MPTAARPRLSVSTWSLHRALGDTYPDTPDGERPGFMRTYGEPSVSLLEIPARAAAMGIRTLEICHFHLPTRDSGYLNELRGALDSAGVQLFSILLDAGDLARPQHGERDLAWAKAWLQTAGQVGAERMRVIAGRSDYSPEAMDTAVRRLKELTELGRDCQVRVTTENWFPLLSRPAYVLELLDRMEGEVGLNADFGNWEGATKYDDLAQIFPRAESCHAKCAFDAANIPDAEDYNRCLSLCQAAGFSGPYTLVYDGQDENEWRGVELERDLVCPYL